MKTQNALLSFWENRRVPIILQTEAAECGLACLCMIASYWGHMIDIANMRYRFSVSLKGATLKNLMQIADRLHLQTRALKLDMPHLPGLRLPCILHWDLNHFVVLKHVSSKFVTIHDPGVGERRIALEEMGRHFTGVALELTPTSEFSKTKDILNFSLISLMGKIHGLGNSLVQLLLLGIALQICALVAPFYLQWTIDEAILSADRSLITVLGCGFLTLIVIQAAIGAVRSWVTTALATNLNFQWLGNTFSHLMKLPMPYFEKRHSGDIVSRFGSIQTIQHSLTTQFVEGLIDGVLVLCTLGMMMLYSLTLAGIACIAAVAYALVRWCVFGKLRNAQAEQIIHAAKQQTQFLESVRGIESIRLFGRRDERRRGWMNTLADQFNAELRVSKVAISYQAANNILFGVERIAVVWIAALAVLDNRFSVGMIFAFVAYKDQFSHRIASLIDKIFELRMLRLHGERVADIVLTKAEAEPSATGFEPDSIHPSIELRNLSFRYSDIEPLIVSDLSLSIPAGQCIAITGPSGCGKTTLMKLLLGLLEPTEGEILVGGVPLQKIGIANHSQIIGTVMQDDTLFSGSIFDNICFFDAAPDFERIQTCAQLAAIHAEILQMPMGYQTLVGDIGTGLSGGQKQRLLLARALYKNPKILVLDEATSHLDIWNENAVNSSILTFPLTRIIVAHRPETIAMAQRVVVLQGGRVINDVLATPDTST